MKITFYGAAGGVTGSKHLVETGHHKILLDCGSFQGHRQEAEQLNRQLPFAAQTIDAVILSHGHLDHCGSLPLLIKNGYKGKIFSTAATRDVAKWIMLDSAKIQEQDALYMKKHGLASVINATPIYNDEDVAQTINQFSILPYASDSSDTWQEILPGLKIKLYQAGHILGSAVTILQSSDEKNATIGYTGDLGRIGTPIIKDPEYIKDNLTALLMESTYGNRHHDPISLAQIKLTQVINQTIKQGGKIIIPAFALGRTQELVYLIHELIDSRLIPAIPIFVDSPLAGHLTNVFSQHPELYDAETKRDFINLGNYPLNFKQVTYISDIEESKKLNSRPGSFIVIASSGMCEAGRILHHLINGVSDDKNTILITGFQAQNTLGRRLVEGEKTARLFGHYYPVKASVVVFNEFSAHADALELTNYAKHTLGLKQIYLVHGEPTQATTLAQTLTKELPNIKTTVPKLYDTVEING